MGFRSISPPRTEAFFRDGYTILDGFIDAAEAAVLRTDVERLLRSPQGESCERPHNTLVPLRWDHTIVEQILASETRANRVREVLGGGDLRWISGYLSLKEPHSPALWWHQDWWCWDHPVSYQPQAPQVALLCYLTATEERNAALRLLPGSHHTSTSLHPLLPEAHTHETGDLPATHPAMRSPQPDNPQAQRWRRRSDRLPPTPRHAREHHRGASRLRPTHIRPVLAHPPG